MPRRKAYSNLRKEGQYRPSHVDGQTLYKGFQCLNPDCTEFIFIKQDDIGDDYSFECPKCGYEFCSGGYKSLFNYSMDVNDEAGETTAVEQGEFVIDHTEYIEAAPLYKYCLICNTLKPIDAFHKHAVLKSGRQGECIFCKTQYNAIKNGTRTTDQHRESAQKRRLVIDVSGNVKINSKRIYERFHYKCFNCGKDLSHVTAKERPLDHTLPVYYLWPLTTESATLLCRDCNGSKSGTWPSKFYTDQKLHELAIVTGIDYDLLSGEPTYNPQALIEFQKPENVDALLVKYSAYMDEVCKLRNRVLADTGVDFFANSTLISPEWVEKANSWMK